MKSCGFLQRQKSLCSYNTGTVQIAYDDIDTIALAPNKKTWLLNAHFSYDFYWYYFFILFDIFVYFLFKFQILLLNIMDGTFSWSCLAMISVRLHFTLQPVPLLLVVVVVPYCRTFLASLTHLLHLEISSSNFLNCWTFCKLKKAIQFCYTKIKIQLVAETRFKHKMGGGGGVFMTEESNTQKISTNQCPLNCPKLSDFQAYLSHRSSRKKCCNI